jgi:hypothetical protein
MVKITRLNSLRMRRHDGTHAVANSGLPYVWLRREGGWGREKT